MDTGLPFNIVQSSHQYVGSRLFKDHPGVCQQGVDFFPTLKQMLKLGPHLGIHGYGLSLNSRRVLLIRPALPSWLACLSA